jgi:hypothetical protein
VSDEPVVELNERDARNGVVKKVTANVVGVPREITARIPPGVKDGTLLRLPGAEPGDETLVRVRVRSSVRWYVAGVAAPMAVLGVVLVATTGGSDDVIPSAPSSTPATSAGEPPPWDRTDPTASGPSTTTVLPGPLDLLPVGDCLRNTGTETNPTMVPDSCVPGTFRVLARNYGTVDGSACSVVEGNTHTYTVEKYLLTTRGGIEVSRSLSVRDSYVFCLRQL